METNSSEEKFNKWSLGKWDIKKILLSALSFIIPIIGVIYFFIKKKDNPSMAKLVLYCAIAGFTLNMINYCSNASNEYESSETYYSSNNEYASNGNSKLNKVLREIAGTYEIYENRGVQGFHTWCVLRIDSDGTGVKVEDDGTRTYINSTHLNSDNTITFSMSDGIGECYGYNSISGSLELLNPRSYNGYIIDGIRKR